MNADIVTFAATTVDYIELGFILAGVIAAVIAENSAYRAIRRDSEACKQTVKAMFKARGIK